MHVVMDLFVHREQTAHHVAFQRKTCGSPLTMAQTDDRHSADFLVGGR